MIFQEPNKYARDASVIADRDKVVFHGYQEFTLEKEHIAVTSCDTNLKSKQQLLTPYFTPEYLAGSSVLDLGANSGFHSFWALQSGAKQVTAVDIDTQYLKMLRQARDQFGFHNLAIHEANVANWHNSADVVLAIALIHWCYSCTALFGSLDAVIRKLRSLTKRMLVVEWIDPEDPAIEFFHHIDWNKDVTTGKYSRQEFVSALERYFDKYISIGKISATRELYVAFVEDTDLAHSSPLPLIRNADSVLQTNLLTIYEGTKYWSRIYDCGDVVIKQATLDLASREKLFLEQLQGEYFPKILDAWSNADYSAVALEKIHGKPLIEARADITATQEKFCDFIKHCLNILLAIQKQGITHRDIRFENILVRNGKPVLIDFGWAISADYPYFTPPYLGDKMRPIDNTFCDVYSMGKVLSAVNGEKYPAVALVLNSMTEPDRLLRVTNIRALKLRVSLIMETSYWRRVGQKVSLFFLRLLQSEAGVVSE